MKRFRIDDQAIDTGRGDQRSGRIVVPRPRDADIVRGEIFDEPVAPFCIRGDDQQLFLVPLCECRHLIDQRVDHLLGLNRLRQERKRPGIQSPLPRLVGGYDRDGNVPGLGIVLQPVEHAPPVDVGQENIECHGGRLVFGRQRECRDAHRRDDALEALFSRHVEEEACEREIVLDNEQDRGTQRQAVAIVAHFVDQSGQRGPRHRDIVPAPGISLSGERLARRR